MTIAFETAHFATAPGGSPSGERVLPEPLPALLKPTRAGLARVAEVLLTRDELWLPVARALIDGGNVTPTRIASLGGWEAWLHVWPAGSSSGWHRHDGPSASAVVSGHLRELRDTGAPGATGSSGAGRHALVNDSVEQAVTLHVYALGSPHSGRAEAHRCRPAREVVARSVKEAS
jgi:hypothetical protein